MTIPHLPILRQGRVYESYDKIELTDYRTNAPLATVSQANVGLIKKDIQKLADCRAKMQSISTQEYLDICHRAAELFMTAELPLGNSTQTVEQYILQLSATSGLPHSLVRANMKKIHTALTGMKSILKGLTRGLGADVLDRGFGAEDGLALSYSPTCNGLAAVLPSNSPGVNSIWLPAVALRTPLVIKPGREEPWTPFRLIQALIQAGCPAEAFSFYPTSHEGADTMLRRCQRGIIFGDDKTTNKYASNPGIERHGTGRSKILIGEDKIENWRDYLDLMATSVVNNGGRSCVNTSAILVPRYADQIAEALAQRLVNTVPRKADDPNAVLSAFAKPQLAGLINNIVENGLNTPGATDVTAKYRDTPREFELDGARYLQPTLVQCDSFDHPLANTEFLFPFASLTEMPQSEMLANIGPSLVVTVISEDQDWISQVVQHPHIDRLNIGELPTTTVEWDQPHEGNLFELLYRRRAIQRSI